jgi:hypothetical protein
VVLRGKLVRIDVNRDFNGGFRRGCGIYNKRVSKEIQKQKKI